VLAVSRPGEHRGPCAPALPSSAPPRHPVLRAPARLLPVQLLDRLPPRPPCTPGGADVEVVVRPGRRPPDQSDPDDWVNRALFVVVIVGSLLGGAMATLLLVLASRSW
jgi:hypothetical protein